MENHSTLSDAAATETLFSGEDWFDPLEASLRGRVRGFLEAMFEAELDAALSRKRYERRKPSADRSDEADRADEEADEKALAGHRHGRRERTLTGTFGPVEISVPRARLHNQDGTSAEWKSKSLRRYQRRTRDIDALIASAYLAGTNTRRVRRVLGALFRDAVSKDVVSRVWRKLKTDWEAWTKRDLSKEEIVRIILDGTGVRALLDRKSTSISLLVALGVRADGQKILLSVKNMGGESEAAWRAFLDDLTNRGMSAPEFLIIDGAPGLIKALDALWPDVPRQRCTVHKHRNLLAHAPEKLHDEISADYTDMIYAKTAQDVLKKRKLFIAKWRLKHRPVADSLAEAGDDLFTFLRLPPEQWKSARTTNAIERLHGEFKRRIKTQAMLPCAETAAMLFWALMASGQITMRKIDGWTTLPKPIDHAIDLAA
jgi:transposase-like protein